MMRRWEIRFPIYSQPILHIFLPKEGGVISHMFSPSISDGISFPSGMEQGFPQGWHTRLMLVM